MIALSLTDQSLILWETRSAEAEILPRLISILGKISVNQNQWLECLAGNWLKWAEETGSGGRDRTADLGVMNPTL
jgi:hypothetical protein